MRCLLSPASTTGISHESPRVPTRARISLRAPRGIFEPEVLASSKPEARASEGQNRLEWRGLRSGRRDRPVPASGYSPGSRQRCSPWSGPPTNPSSETASWNLNVLIVSRSNIAVNCSFIATGWSAHSTRRRTSSRRRPAGVEGRAGYEGRSLFRPCRTASPQTSVVPRLRPKNQLPPSAASRFGALPPPLGGD